MIWWTATSRNDIVPRKPAANTISNPSLTNIIKLWQSPFEVVFLVPFLFLSTAADLVILFTETKTPFTLGNYYYSNIRRRSSRLQKKMFMEFLIISKDKIPCIILAILGILPFFSLVCLPPPSSGQKFI